MRCNQPAIFLPLSKSVLMKFFIDTANLAQIKEANELGILDGVTTNPSLMAKEGIKGEKAVMDHYRTICEMVNGDISAEVISTDFAGIVEEGNKLAAIHPNIVVKVPMIKDGIKAIRYFSEKGIRTNCTLVVSAGQAILAAKAGATYVSPLVKPTSIQFKILEVILKAAHELHLESLASSMVSNFHVAALSFQNLIFGLFGFNGPYPYLSIAI